MLTTTQKVKLYLDIDDTSEDFFIRELIQQANSIIEGYCNRRFEKKVYTEEVQGIEKLWVKNTPILDVLELIDEDNNNVSYRFTDDKIIIKRQKNISLTGVSYVPSPKIKNYFVMYEGGYETIPADIQKVATEMVVLAFKEARDNTLNAKSRSEGSVNVSFVDKVMIQPQHLAILDKYKMIHI